VRWGSVRDTAIMRHMKDTVGAAKNWINALNTANSDALVSASEPRIAIVGPRGIAHGVEILREWYAHTHLTFDLKELLVHDSRVIALGTAHWHNDEGDETGAAPTAFLMDISPDGLVAELARHDEGLEAALAASGVPDRARWRVEKGSYTSP
jgi:hypothetical protein